ncbi:PAS domain S-box protein [Massilia sp. B-10]|nr:PAS domain S-box protein [Massilia sp. B-10]
MIDTLPISIVSRLIEESLDAVLVIDEQGCIRYMNGAMQRLSGYAPDEAIGQPLQGMMPDAYGQQEQGYIDRILANIWQSDVLGSVRAFAIRHRTGEMIPR